MDTLQIESEITKLTPLTWWGTDTRSTSAQLTNHIPKSWKVENHREQENCVQTCEKCFIILTSIKVLKCYYVVQNFFLSFQNVIVPEPNIIFSALFGNAEWAQNVLRQVKINFDEIFGFIVIIIEEYCWME